MYADLKNTFPALNNWLHTILPSKFQSFYTINFRKIKNKNPNFYFSTEEARLVENQDGGDLIEIRLPSQSGERATSMFVRALNGDFVSKCAVCTIDI